MRIPAEGDDEIARLSRSFNSMTEALASSRELQQQLIADAGHELRTPLTSLRTNIELLVRSEETGRPLPEAGPQGAAGLRQGADDRTGRARRRPAGAVPPRRGPARRSAARSSRCTTSLERGRCERVRLRGPELTITAELAPWYVRAEPGGAGARGGQPPGQRGEVQPATGGTVEVALQRGHADACATTAPASPEDELPYVFDRFWRSPSARSLPGSGLGLSIVARTVRQAGGEVALGRPGTAAPARRPCCTCRGPHRAARPDRAGGRAAEAAEG